MITLFIILLIVVTFKVLGIALKLGWGLIKLLLSIILFPLTLLGMALSGLMSIAFPMLIVAGVIAFAGSLIKE